MKYHPIPILGLCWLLCVPLDSLAEEAIRHRILCADSSARRLAIIAEDGTTQWEMEIGPLHDLHMLDDGNILCQTNWTRVIEVSPATGQVRWEYDCSKSPENAGRKVEVHAFQRLAEGITMLVESGSSRIIDVDPQGKSVQRLGLQVSSPHPHRDTRLVRKLASGNYLVCHEGDGVVKEYSPAGKVVWEYAVPLFGRQPAAGHGLEAFGNQCFCALRLDSGNTLISTGSGHSILEVTSEKKIVWQLAQYDLEGIGLAWVTTLQVLPNGHIVLGNCHAGEDNPQVIEVTRDKRVVWTFRDFERFGNALTNTQVLTTNGQPIAARLGRDR